MPTLDQEFKNKVIKQGLWAAMQWLNSQVPYRYTAIFAFDGDMLRNVCLVDKQDSSVTNCEAQPITNSYCIYIHRSREPFTVEEAASDERVHDHPKRLNYQCYYGVPLISSDGKLIGTVCHFDINPRTVTAGVVSMLDDLAPIISQAAFNSGESD